MGRKKVVSEEELKDMGLPAASDVLVSPWDFQFEEKGDIIWRYKRNQAEWLRRKGHLKT